MDATEKALHGATAQCTGCPKLCRFTCPVAIADGRESSTPTSKMTTASLLVEGRLPLTPENAEPLYRCTGCQLQHEVCKHEIDVPQTLEAARAFTFGKGAIPEAIRAALPRIRTDRDPAATDLHARAAALSVGPTNAPVRLLAGCRMLRDDADGVGRALTLLQAATGARVSLWNEEPICCGYPLLALGDRAGLAGTGKKLAKALRGTGKLVAADPSCAFTLAKMYPEMGIKLPCPVSTLPEALADGMARLSPPRRDGERWVYHDPCHLGRRLSVYDAPRQLLRSTGAVLLEPPWHGAGARCAGFGGLYPLLDPKGALAIARTRLSELEGVGADGIATACPTCRLALRLAGGKVVKDLAEVLS